ncbi:aldose 1-epimerase [Arcanobacterium haemolyticum]|nr:aldose 1-epimerase [Arcanobacterium haemolyticum]
MVAFVTSITEEDFDGLKAWRLSVPDGPSALVAEHGATLISWQPAPGAEVIEGYTSAAELRAHAGGRSAIMAPWAGHISGDSYQFGGVKVPVDASTMGLVASSEFERVYAGDALCLTTRIAACESYPWDLDISVIFSLEGGAQGFEHLSITIDATNTSDKPAPVSLSWQPYVKLPELEGISNLSLQIPARTKVLYGGNAVPLTGDAAFAGVASPVRVDYLGALRIEESFTNLVPNEDGVVVTSLTNPARGTQVLLTQEPSEAPVVRVYTGDENARNPREAIAVSPRSALDNAFNRADVAARLPLEPGQTRSLTATLSYRGAK